MLEILKALLLGIIQGLTEFLPVSSSAHLNIFPWIFNWEITESFDVALHIGTLFAMLIFFFKDWIALLVGGYKQTIKKEKNAEGKMFWILVVATIAGAVLSLGLDKVSEMIIGDNLNLEMVIIAITLIIMGIVLYLADAKASSNIGYEDIDMKKGVLIGVSQGLAAAFPGVSRSGITMTVARTLGIDRESAARFSFMLAAPITAAAVVFDLDKFSFDASFFVGVAVSFIVGLAVIKFLLDFLKKRSYKAFAVYRVILGAVVIALFFIK